MKVLLDTHVLLWAAGEQARLARDARELIEDRDTELVFSAVSIWEVAIKNGLGRDDFSVDPRLLRRGLLENGYTELAVTGSHAVAVDSLPPVAQGSLRPHARRSGTGGRLPSPDGGSRRRKLWGVRSGWCDLPNVCCD